MDYQQESIIRYVFKAFLKTIFVVIAFFVALVPIMFLMGAFSDKSYDSMKNNISYCYDLKGNNEVLPLSSPVILKINMEGEIGTPLINSKILESQLFESRKGLFKKDRVKAILLNLNTPGGSAPDSDYMYRMIKSYKEKYKVPVYAYSESLCASAGMLIACAADKINTSPSCVVGSIGSRIGGTFFNVNKLLDKYGVDTKELSAGKDKDILSPFREWKPNEDESLVKIVDYLYERFVDIFVSSRTKVSKDKLINVYGAQIFDPKTAEEIGYIDNGFSSYEETLKELLAAANIDETKPYQVVELKPRFAWLQSLLKNESSSLSEKIKHIIQIGNKSSDNYNISPLMYLYDPEKIKDGKVFYNRCR